MTNARNLHAKTRERQILVEKLGGKCVFCGSTYNLQFAHIKPTSLKGRGRGRKERFRDIRQNIDCYALMCGGSFGCHKSYDKGLIRFESTGDV
jgi:hypothetical protein